MTRRYVSRFSRSGIQMVPIDVSDRTACNVLEHIRTMIKTYNFAGLSADIETLQEMYQRMEDALYFYSNIGYDIDTLKELDEEKKKIKDEIKELRAKRYLISNGKDSNPEEKDQPLYNQGYEAGIKASKNKEKKED